MKHLALLSVTAAALVVLFSFFPPTPAPATESVKVEWQTKVIDISTLNSFEINQEIKADWEVKAMTDKRLILQRPR